MLKTKTNNNLIVGLNQKEVSQLRSKFGYNETELPRENILLFLLKNIKNPLTIALIISAIITYLIGNQLETWLILVLLLINNTITTYQHINAEKSFKKLQSNLTIYNRVLRDGNWTLIPSRELVPGDIVRYRKGDITTADALVLTGSVEVDDSNLTGESIPKLLSKNSQIMGGSVIVQGEATTKIVKTGLNSKYLNLTNSLDVHSNSSSLDTIVFSIVKYQFFINLIVVAIIFAFNFYFKLKIFDLISMTVALLLYSIPAAFPSMFIIAQTFGALKMSEINNKRGIIIKKLFAVQEAALINVLCLDKTGTLTLNQPKVVSINHYYEFSDDEIVLISASSSNISDQDPIDKALISQADVLGLKLCGQLLFNPFDVQKKSTSAQIVYKNKTMLVTKGLPESLINQKFDYDQKLNKDISQITALGQRAIAVGITINNKSKIIGLIGLEDTIKSDSIELLSEIKKLGIQVKIITGDGLRTAKTISAKLGLSGGCIEISKALTNPSLILKNEIFAEAYPEDKLKLINILQNSNYIVSMTGDGVNDAPSLTKANVGIAVANATDIAKNSAGIILTDKNLEQIVEYIKLSRQVDARVKIWAINKTVKTFQITLLTLFSLFILKTIILTPLIVILIFLANDLINMSIATDNIKESSKPSQWNIIKILKNAFYISFFQLGFLLLSYFLTKYIFGLSFKQLESVILIQLVFQGTASLLAFRFNISKAKLMPSKPLIISILSSTIAISFLASSGILISRISLMVVLVVAVIALINYFFLTFFKNENI